MFKAGDKVIVVSTEATRTRHGLVPSMKSAFENGTVIEVTSADAEAVSCIHESFNCSFKFASCDLMLANKAPTLCPVIAMKDAQGGVKHDSGKPRMELLPPEGLEEVAKVFAFGANKYGDYNWRGGIKTSRLAGAMLRHVFAYLRGETNDPESGLPHMAHAMCNGLMILTMNKARPDLDDRYKDVK